MHEPPIFNDQHGVKIAIIGDHRKQFIEVTAVVGAKWGLSRFLSIVLRLYRTEKAAIGGDSVVTIGNSVRRSNAQEFLVIRMIMNI